MLTLATRKFWRMKAFARFENEIWFMDQAFVDKLAKNFNGEMYLLVRQDVFDRSVYAKGSKTKVSQETVRAFLTMITKKNQATKKIAVEKVQKLLESSKTYAKLKEFKCTPLRVRLNLRVMNVQYDLLKAYFSVICKIMDTSRVTNCLISSETWIPEKLLNRLDTQKCQNFWRSVHSVQQDTTREWKAQIQDWRQSSHLEVWLTPQGGL